MARCSALPRPRQRRNLPAVGEAPGRGGGRPEPQLPMPSRSLVGPSHGYRGAADSLRSAERVAPHRTVHEDATARGAGPLHLPQCRSHPSSRQRVRPLLQRGAPVAGDSRDSRSIPGATAATTDRGTIGCPPHPGWRPARLPVGRVALFRPFGHAQSRGITTPRPVGNLLDALALAFRSASRAWIVALLRPKNIQADDNQVSPPRRMEFSRSTGFQTENRPGGGTRATGAQLCG